MSSRMCRGRATWTLGQAEGELAYGQEHHMYLHASRTLFPYSLLAIADRHTCRLVGNRSRIRLASDFLAWAGLSGTRKGEIRRLLETRLASKRAVFWTPSLHVIYRLPVRLDLRSHNVLTQIGRMSLYCAARWQYTTS